MKKRYQKSNFSFLFDKKSYIKKRNTCTTIHQIADALGKAIDAKDTYTFQHSQQVAIISYIIALQIGLNEDDAELIHIAAHLHDIGKIGIPDNILLKNGPFDFYEKEVMKSHSLLGYEILNNVDIFKETGISTVVLHHHEHYDGQGYPNGLKGEEIPLGSRIISIADTISAITQDRPYRKKRDFEYALTELERCSGTQFDPILVKYTKECIDIIKLWLEEI